MIEYNEKKLPTLRGENERAAVVLTEDQLNETIMNQPSTVLPKDAIVEFLDKLVVKAQKRRSTDADDAPKNNFILMSVNGNQRWIGLGTFTRRRFDVNDRPFISPISEDIPEEISITEFYNKMKDKKFKVVDVIDVETNVFDDAGNRTDEKTITRYPVLDYYNG